MKKKVTLITGHYIDSKRKAGFHWLAEAYLNLGYEVLFFTAPISYLSKINGDYKFQYPIKEEKGKLIKKRESLYSYIHFTPWHVANARGRILNKITAPLANFYENYRFTEAEKFIKTSEAIIFESTPGLLLFDKIKTINSKARFVYRVSDDLRLLGVHPVLITYESTILERFDLVSVPSQYIYDLFKGIKNLKLQFHGISKKLFDDIAKCPYETGVNLVFVGNDKLDHEFLNMAISIKKEWTFHIIGNISNLPNAKNLIAYGEMAFDDTIPYLKYATIGLHTISYKKGAESFTDSLKVHQYTFCQLPIIAPKFLDSNRQHMFLYNRGDAKSIEQALNNAIQFEGKLIDKNVVSSWDSLAKAMLWI